MKQVTIFTMQLKKFGGIERFVVTIANMLSAEFEVTIVANYGKATDKLAFELSDNIKIIYLSPALPREVSMKEIIVNKKFHKIPGEIWRRIKINVNRKNVISNYFKKLNTDFIITDRELYNTLIRKKYKGNAKLIACEHNYHQNDKKYIKRVTRSVKGFDYLVVATKELQDFYKNKIGRTKCIQIINAIPYIPTKKSSLRKKNIISIGRFHPIKDYLSLIEVMRQVNQIDNEIRLFLIGDGPQKNEIMKKIKKMHLEDVVILTGPLHQKQMEKYYYDSSLFVLTSISEAFALVIAEAMSYGLPVIAFDRASGARAQITPEIGVLIPNADIHQMAVTICDLLNSHGQLSYFQKNINKIIYKYSTESVFLSWKDILK